MCSRDFEALTEKISKKVMGYFIEWQDENESKIRNMNSNFSETFTANTQKVMGTNFTTEKRISSIRKALYKHLKINLNIADCEITF